MREIKKAVTTQQRVTKFNKTNIRKTLLLDSLLVTQIDNFIKSQWTQGNFSYANVSDFIRQALEFSLTKKISFSNKLITNKKEVSVLLSASLHGFYQSLPKGKKNPIINQLLSDYLEDVSR